MVDFLIVRSLFCHFKVNLHRIMLRNSLRLVISLSVLVACGPADNAVTYGSGSAGAGANNSAPDAGAPIFESIFEDAAPLIVDVSENASDAEDDDLTYTVTSIDPIDADVVVDLISGILTYSPAENFNGHVTVVYEVSDTFRSSPNTVDVDVDAVNDAPTAPDHNDIEIDEDSGMLLIDLLTDSSDIDGDEITLDEITISAPNGTVILSADLTSAEYTPNPDFFGADSFEYQISDTTGATATGLVSIEVIGQNDAPVANAAEENIDEDSVDQTLDLANFSEHADPVNLTYSIDANGLAAVLNGSVVTFNPDENFNGDAVFTYTVSDDDPTPETASNSVTFHVAPVNDDPKAINGTMELDEDTVSNIDLATLISDVDGDNLSISISVLPGNGSIVNSGGTVYEFIPTPDYEGMDSFTYGIDDGNGGNAEGTVTITVNFVNDDPTASNGTDSGDEDTSVSTDVVALGDDVDINDNLSLSSVSTASNGTVTMSGDLAVYTPNLDYHGIDSYTFTLEDDDGLTATASITVTVNSVNDDPTAINGTDSGDEDASVSTDVVALGDDVDINDNLSLSSVSTASNGTVTMSGDLAVYTPNLDYHGIDSYTFTLEDGDGLTATASITVTVNSVDDSPVAMADSFEVLENMLNAPLDVLSNDTDGDGDLLVVSAVDDSQVTNGILTLNAGLLLFTPDADYFGPAGSFTYTVSDGTYSDTATATITVTQENAFADSLAYELMGVATQPQGFYSQVTENGSAFLLNIPGYNPLLTNLNGQGDVLFTATVDAALPNQSYTLTSAVLSTATNNNLMLAMNFDSGSMKIATCMSFDAIGNLLWSKSVRIANDSGHSVSAVAGLPNGGALLAVYSDSSDSTIMVVLGSYGVEEDEITYDFGSHIINAIVPYAGNEYIALSDSGILVLEDDGDAVFHYGGAVGSSINIASARVTTNGILMSGSDQSGVSIGAYSSLYDPTLAFNPVWWSNTLADPLGQLDIEHNDLVLDDAGNFVSAGSISNIAGGTVVPTLHRLDPVGVSVSLSSFAAFTDGRFEGLIPNQTAANVVGSYNFGANFNFFTMSFDAADTVVSSCSTFGSAANQNFVSTPGTDVGMNLSKTNTINNSSSNRISIGANPATITLRISAVTRESLCL